LKNVLDIATPLIKESEGCKLKAYWDPNGGVWTVGYGATKNGICKLTQWTQEVAEHDLQRRLEGFLTKLHKASPILINASPSRQAALISFVYNGGMGMYTGHSLKPFIDSQDWEGAAKEILKFDHSGGKILRGLTIRRWKEAELLLCST
jgi:lysozyme